MSTIKYQKPSGAVMEVRDDPAVRALANNLGWIEAKASAKKAVPKKAVRKKAAKKKAK